MHYSSPKFLPRRQEGVAVITALLLTTLAITLIANLFWQQQVQVRSIENQRLQLQKQWIMRGALDLVRLIIREDALRSSQDHLGEPWAAPLASTPISEYIDVNNEGAFMTGQIVDAQSRFNLSNLSTAQVLDRDAIATFSRLLVILNLDPKLAQASAVTIAASQTRNLPLSASPSEQTAKSMPLLHENDLLAVPGMTKDILQQLKDHVVILPRSTAVNINTASAPVIAASIEDLPLSAAIALVSLRDRQYFRTATDLQQALPSRDSGKTYSLGNAAIAFSSNFFLVLGKVSIGNAMVGMQAIAERSDLGTRIITMQEQ